MNRLILVGNGFDIAHNLKTSYADFIKWYFENLIEYVRSSEKERDGDDLCQFSIKQSGDVFFEKPIVKFSDFTHKQIQEYIKHNFSYVSYESDPVKVKLRPLIKIITQAYETKGWVDIENEYYELLKDRYRGNSAMYSSVDVLNKELSFLTRKLAEYLDNITKKIVDSEIIINDIMIASDQMYHSYHFEMYRL